jgi:hypothetical protein
MSPSNPVVEKQKRTPSVENKKSQSDQKQNKNKKPSVTKWKKQNTKRSEREKKRETSLFPPRETPSVPKSHPEPDVNPSIHFKKKKREPKESKKGKPKPRISFFPPLIPWSARKKFHLPSPRFRNPTSQRHPKPSMKCNRVEKTNRKYFKKRNRNEIENQKRIKIEKAHAKPKNPGRNAIRNIKKAIRNIKKAIRNIKKAIRNQKRPGKTPSDIKKQAIPNYFSHFRTSRHRVSPEKPNPIPFPRSANQFFGPATLWGAGNGVSQG